MTKRRSLALSTRLLAASLMLMTVACGQEGVGYPTGGGQTPLPADPTPAPYDPTTPDPYPTAQPTPLEPQPGAGLGFDPRTLVNPHDADVGLGGLPHEDLDNFQIVEPTLFRGARPSRQGLQTLRRLGVRTIVNLEKGGDAVESEKSYGQELGLKVIHIPMGIVAPPSSSKVDQFLSLAGNPVERPLYFHCKQGRDRTGVMALAYRVQVQHWQPDYAYAEMLQYGFHTSLLGLKWWAKKYAKERYTPAPQPVFPTAFPSAYDPQPYPTTDPGGYPQDPGTSPYPNTVAGYRVIARR